MNKRHNAMFWNAIKSNWKLLALQFFLTWFALFWIMLGVRMAYAAIKRDFGNHTTTHPEQLNRKER